MPDWELEQAYDVQGHEACVCFGGWLCCACTLGLSFIPWCRNRRKYRDAREKLRRPLRT
jgi:hypothetical protein